MNKLFFILSTIITLFAAPIAAGEVYNEVLVDRAPVYYAGDAVDVYLTFPQLGRVRIRLQSQGVVQKHGSSWMQLNAATTLPALGAISVPVFVRPGTWNGYAEYEGVTYRVDSTLRFPLREGDTFTNTYMSSQVCRKGAGTKCMEIDSIETCSGFVPTFKGIQYVCAGSDGLKIQYIMDREFKWLESFKSLN